MDALGMSRVAAYVLNELFQDMGNLAYRFNGDDAGLWTVAPPDRVVCHPQGLKCADVLIGWNDDGTVCDAYVVVQDIYRVVRSEHVGDFVPGEHGYAVNTVADWKDEVEPDLMVTMYLQDIEIPGLNAPRRMVPQTPTLRRVKVIGSLG